MRHGRRWQSPGPGDVDTTGNTLIPPSPIDMLTLVIDPPAEVTAIVNLTA